MTELLEVDKYPNGDLFFASLFRIAAGKLQLEMLEHPFFSLQSRGRDMSTYRYLSNDGSFALRIAPSEQGRMTMKDADFVAYLQAKLVKMKEEGKLTQYGPVKMIVEVTEFLEFANREKGGANYANFKNMIIRLTGTRIEVERVEENSKPESVTTILGSEWDSLRSKEGDIPICFRITINEWFVRPIIDDNRFLTMPRSYFRIKKDIHKRFFQIARMHASGVFEISWEKFHNKVGTKEALSKFRSKLRKEFKDNDGFLEILNFKISESSCKKKVVIQTIKKTELLEDSKGAGE